MSSNLLEEKVVVALSVHRFLSSIPDVIQRHIFNQILDDAFEQSELLPLEKCRQQFFHAAIVHLKKSELKSLSHLLFSNYADVFFNEINNPNFDIEKLLSLPLELPTKRNLLKAFKLYSSYPYVEESSNQLKSSLIELLSTESEEFSFQKDDMNPFERIGYLTLMMNFIENQRSPLFEKYKALFECWYSNGQILDVVFDTIFNCKSSSIKRGLWNCLVNGCYADYYLCNVVNARWQEYMSFQNITSFASNFTFKTNAQPVKEYEMVTPLGKIDNGETINYVELYEHLCFINVIDERECTKDDFEAIFSDDQNKIKRITFHCVSEQDVSAIMYLFHWVYKEINQSSSLDSFKDKFKKTLRCMVFQKTKNEEKVSNYSKESIQSALRNKHDKSKQTFYKRLRDKMKECKFLSKDFI